MAFGFPPKYIREIDLDNQNSEHFIVLAIEAAKNLEWEIGHSCEKSFSGFTPVSMSSWKEEINVNILNNRVILKSQCIGNQILDWGKNKKNIERLLKQIKELEVSMSGEEIEQKLDKLKIGISSDETIYLASYPAEAKTGIGSFISLFIPSKDYFITPILINLNIVLFILMVATGVDFMQPESENLLKWGANFRPMTLEGQYWRLFTNCFLHIGIFHLLMNMYALAYIGVLLEPHLGKIRFISAYLLTGIIASVASLWWHDLTISAGASGAIFGVYGVFLAMLTTNLIEKTARKALLSSIAIFVGYNLVNGLKGNIDNAAHIGGLLSGLAIGYAFVLSLKKPTKNNLKFGIIGAFTAITILLSITVLQSLPNDTGLYDRKIQKFALFEERALELYQLPENTPNERYLSEIKLHGIKNWNNAIQLLKSLDNLDLPKEVQMRNVVLIDYCELRIKSYELIYKAIAENTTQYQKEIVKLNKQIEQKISELGGGKK